MLPRAAVLRNAGHHARRNALFRDARKIVHPAHRIKRRNHAHALRVHHALNQRLTNRLARLLKRRNRAGRNRLAQKPPVDFQFAQPQMQQRNLSIDVPRAQQRADPFRGHRRHARADHAPAQPGHQQHVQPRIHHARQRQIDHRRSAVSDAAQRRRQNVVLKRKQEADENHLQIARRHLQNLVRHVHQPQHRPAQRPADGKHDERRDCAEDNRRGDLAAKRVLVPRAVKPAHQHGRADAHARYA